MGALAELSIPLSERVEFASREWCAEAERYLHEQAGKHLAALDGYEFSVTERWQDAPPHLGWSGNVAGFWLRVSDGAVEVGAGPAADADIQIDGDYNTILPIAWTIYNGDAKIQARAAREYSSLAPDRPTRVQGSLPDDPGVMAILGGLHDHMARRTVNNPDIEHRIEHYGLRSNTAQLADQGYTILEGAFTDAFADELRAEADRNHNAQAPDQHKSARLLERGRLWEETAVHPWVLTLADHMLGRGNLLGISETIRKGPGLDTHPGLHTDYSAWRIEAPFPETALECTAVWAIDDFDAAAGPTVFLPGSWKERRPVPPGATREDCVLLEMPKGSIAFWHGASWHGSQVRTAPGWRHSLHNGYLRFHMRPIERFDELDQAIIDRNPPVFSTLCGLDDLFGRSGVATGADMERYAYAAKSGYGSSAPLTG